MAETLIDKAMVYPDHGRIDFDTITDSGVVNIRVSFEAIEQFYEKIKPHLERRRGLGLIEGETMKVGDSG